MDSLNVLLVDDDKNIRQTLRVSLKGLGCDVEVAESAEEALSLISKKQFDLVLTDHKMSGKSGVELIQEYRQECRLKGKLEAVPMMVVMTAFASFENAVSAIQAGAFDYLPKPFNTGQLSHLLSKVRTITQLKKENEQLKQCLNRSDYFLGMSSPAMKRLDEFVSRVAPTDATVLLTGESGTGKSELARVIHLKSNRSQNPFIVVNCATLTESVFESELFGHVKGAFTGAIQDHVGKLELAQGGTLFIDEIGELSISAQTRLLRFLHEKVIERVGSNRTIEVNARVIAATNIKLEEAVASGKFREDLYYRLNIFECAVVPLRYRKEDVPVFIQRFLTELSFHSNGQVKVISEPVMKAMLNYSWPGNIRELKNAVERLVVLSGDREIHLDDLSDAVKRNIQKKDSQAGEFPLKAPLRTIDELIREHIEKVLALEPNQEKAAEILGITTVTLWRRRKEYGLP